MSEKGSLYIVDLGIDGFKLADELQGFFEKSGSPSKNAYWLAKMAHREIVHQLVRYLNLPPTEAIDRIKDIASIGDIKNIFSLLDLREFDVFSNMVHGYALELYLKIRTQINKDWNILYIPVEEGYDYVVLSEVIADIVDKNKMLKKE